MASNNKNNDFEKPNVDEEYLMNIISGDELVAPPSNNKKQDVPKETKPREKARNSSSKKVNYEETFLVNRFPSGVTARSFTYALNTTKDCSASFN